MGFHGIGWGEGSGGIPSRNALTASYSQSILAITTVCKYHDYLVLGTVAMGTVGSWSDVRYDASVSIVGVQNGACTLL
jgi:hypothetical protein